MADINTTLDGYRLRTLLQTGQTSQVFEVVELKSNRHFAMKILLPEAAEKADQRRALFNEAEVGENLTHPNVIRIVKVSRAKATPHFIMEFFPSGSLRLRLQAKDFTFIKEHARKVFKGMGTGLAYMNATGYVHRDVKPDNILFHPNGGAKLADLGLAKRLNDTSQLTAIHQGVGTTYYMPYEQAVNANLVDGRSDLFALGATLYHLLSGEVPFHGTTHDDVIREKAHGQFRPLRSVAPGVPVELAELIESLLACDPRARVQHAGSLADSLTATGLAGKLPTFADGHAHTAAPLDVVPDMPTRADHRVPLTPPGESFAGDANTRSISNPRRLRIGGWPWILGAGSVVLALLANHWVRSNAKQEPLEPTVVKETLDPSDGLPPVLPQ